GSFRQYLDQPAMDLADVEQAEFLE
ncbi:MAG: hypothetical protein JWO52_3841, partial [Gammaproteobacteria bacterium]|nr:hypothetical protein [Gammaproteobacteria bacterium]